MAYSFLIYNFTKCCVENVVLWIGKLVGWWNSIYEISTLRSNRHESVSSLRIHESLWDLWESMSLWALWSCVIFESSFESGKIFERMRYLWESLGSLRSTQRPPALSIIHYYKPCRLWKCRISINTRQIIDLFIQFYLCKKAKIKPLTWTLIKHVSTDKIQKNNNSIKFNGTLKIIEYNAH